MTGIEEAQSLRWNNQDLQAVVHPSLTKGTSQRSTESEDRLRTPPEVDLRTTRELHWKQSDLQSKELITGRGTPADNK